MRSDVSLFNLHFHDEVESLHIFIEFPLMKFLLPIFLLYCLFFFSLVCIYIQYISSFLVLSMCCKYTHSLMCLFESSLYQFLILTLTNLSLSLAALGLRCRAQAFSSCSERGLLFIAVRGLLTAVASLVVEHRLQ